MRPERDDEHVYADEVPETVPLSKFATRAMRVIEQLHPVPATRADIIAETGLGGEAVERLCKKLEQQGKIKVRREMRRGESYTLVKP